MTAERKPLPRGVEVSTLIEHVRNTIPFFFENLEEQSRRSRATEILARTILRIQSDPNAKLTHFEYFSLCLSAHYCTVASFVPTDVDNQIREKLWHPALRPEEFDQMRALTLEARAWNTRVLNTRQVALTPSSRPVTGIDGEWFSVVVGAYAASRRQKRPGSEELLDAITEELERQAQVLSELYAQERWMDALSCGTLIAHNLGDLDRVTDQWKLGETDPLRVEHYKLGHERPDRFKGTFWLAGEMNKRMKMADENHRHLPLRAAKPLRKSEDLFLPMGPFFDAWGERVAKHPALSSDDLGGIGHELVLGWERYPTTFGYARALAGMDVSFKGGVVVLGEYMPSVTAKRLRSGQLRTLISQPREKFERQWIERTQRTYLELKKELL